MIPWTAVRQVSLSFTTSQGLLKLMFIELRMPSHPQSPPSPPALNLSQHQGLFQWVSSSHQVAKVLELQHQSLQWIFRVYLLKFDWLDPLAVQGILRVFSSSTVQKHQFFSTQPSLWPNSQNCTDYWKNHSFDYMAEIQKICMEMDVKGVV